MFQGNQKILLTLDSYDVIHYYSEQSSLSSSYDESGCVVAPLKSFNVYQGGAGDNFSTSENVFPTLFTTGVESETAVTVAEEHSNNDSLQEPLLHRVTENKEVQEPIAVTTDNAYRKVADWVQSQQPYFAHRDTGTSDLDDIEVIDPVDLFHDSMLNDYLLLTETESEKRGLLRHLSGHKYNIESLPEALQKYGYEFVRSPRPKECMELTVLTKDGSWQHDGMSLNSDSVERAFVGLNTVLEKYFILNDDGQERFDDAMTDDDYVISTNCGLDRTASLPCIKDAISSLITDVENISTFTEPTTLSKRDHCHISEVGTVEIENSIITVIHDKGSDDNDSEIWEDAKDIPHWLDGEHEEVFSQPHRPLYYYRDRVKGCYRIIGVEDDTVVLFSGNDDDSIFYNGNMSAKIAGENDGFPLHNTMDDAARLVASDGIGSQSDSSDDRSERKKDSGIEDMEDVVNEYALISISARDSTLVKSDQLQIRQQKTVTFRSRRLVCVAEYLFVVASTLLFVFSMIITAYMSIFKTTTL